MDRLSCANGFVLAADWIELIEPANRCAVESLRAELDAGESEAIVLAQQLRASLLLMDERLGRQTAIRLGLEVTGLLGILAEARKRGHIAACASLLD
jgi:predicted nucleic acid-binding protein